MKKIISVFIVCMLLCGINVGAMNFSDMTEKLVKYYKVEVTEDISGISKLQNRKNLKNPKLISAAIKNGIIVVKDGLVNEDGTDFTPLTDGIIKRYINNDNYIFLSGTAAELKANKKFSHIPVVIISSYQTDEVMKNIPDADAFIKKSNFCQSTLLNTIEKLLKS